MGKMQAGLIAASVMFAVMEPAAAAACSSSIAGEMKFEFVEGRPVVSGAIADKPGRLQVALGSRWNFINDAAVDRLGLKTANIRDIIAYSGDKQIAPRSVRTGFDLGGLKFAEAFFLVDPKSGNYRGLDGALGDQIFDSYEVELDPSKSILRLISTQDCKDEVLSYWPGAVAVAPLNVWVEGSTTEVQINGHRVVARIATSVPISVLSLEGARAVGAQTSGMLAAPPGGDGSPTWWLPVESFSIGEETVKSTRLRVADLNGGRPTETETGSRLPTPQTAAFQMVLGADFFASHRVLFSKRQRRLYITYLGGGVFRREATGPSATPSPTPGAR
jgi:hypothetical protein